MQTQEKLALHDVSEDLGFKVYKLGASHFNAWQDYEGGNLAEIQSLFDRFENPLVDGWDSNGLLTEVLLMEGFPLDSKVELQAEFHHNSVSCVSSSDGGHRLWTCFDSQISSATLSTLPLPPEDVFVCLDSALSDDAKLHLSQMVNLRTI